MKKNPVVSVVIPALKEGKTIRKVIRDLKSSSSYNTEIIVVDGHSNDGTEEIVKEENADFIAESKGTGLRRGGKSSEFFYLDKPKCKQ